MKNEEKEFAERFRAECRACVQSGLFPTFGF